MALDIKELEKLGLEDLIDLRDNKVPESKLIDYKLALKFGDKDKREFLADISSFANTAGGHLLIGVKEEGGFPTDFPGVELDDPDAEKLKLTNIIRDSVEPRIPGVTIHNIHIRDSSYVIVIRIPKSWVAPHVVTFDKHWRFYGRHSSGKYPLDVPELRQSFLLTDTLSDKMKYFRTQRLGQIISNELPVGLPDFPKIVLQLVPFSAFGSIKPNGFSLPDYNHHLAPIHSNGYTSRINFDGLLVFCPYGSSSPAYSYTQLYRNGIIEAVESLILGPNDHSTGAIPCVALEQNIIKAVNSYLAQFKAILIVPPAFLMLTLLNVKGMSIPTSNFDFTGNATTSIDRDNLIIPEILIEDFNTEADILLKPAFDAIWNASGYEGSLCYNAEGRWKGLKR